MPFILWKKSYSVGVKEFDAQHKGIFKLINELYKAINEDDVEKTHELAGQLSSLGSEHLACEEKYFHKYNYPNKKEHLEEHTRFRSMADGFRSLYENDDKNIHIASINFLREWVLEHLLQQDMQYVSFFAEKNMKQKKN